MAKSGNVRAYLGTCPGASSACHASQNVRSSPVRGLEIPSRGLEIPSPHFQSDWLFPNSHPLYYRIYYYRIHYRIHCRSYCRNYNMIYYRDYYTIYYRFNYRIHWGISGNNVKIIRGPGPGDEAQVSMLTTTFLMAAGACPC